MKLNDYLYLNNVRIFEGFSQELSEQVEALQSSSSNPSVKNIMEIGFNAGHSADIFLSANPECTVTSFDLGVEGCVKLGKEYMDIRYPSRHNLILGDSTKTVPEFIKQNPNTKFDLIFIDGGHQYEVAKQDIYNCKKLAHKDTILIMDDIIYGSDILYAVGPTKVWSEAISWDIVTEIKHVNIGNTRGFSIGKYNL